MKINKKQKTTKLKADWKQSVAQVLEIITGSVAVIILSPVKGEQLGIVAKVSAVGIAIRVLTNIVKLSKKLLYNQD